MNTVRRPRFRLGLLAAALALSASPLIAQTAPKLNQQFKDEVNLGFSVKMPSWDFVPAQSHEVNTIGKYSNGRDNYIIDYKASRMIDEARVEILKFDRRAKPDAEGDGKDGKPEIRIVGKATFADWAKDSLGDWKELERKDVKVDGMAATRIVYSRLEGSKDDGTYIGALVYVYPLSADLDVAVLGIGPGDKKKWSKWESVYDQMGKSLKHVDVAAGKTNGPRSSSPRDLKRYELEQQIAVNPGWMLFESPNYFIVTSKTDDKKFIEELMMRLEAIREVYEELYPAQLVMDLRLRAKARANAEPKAAQEGDEPEADPAKTEANAADPMEMSRTSVVRVCKDSDEYSSYGGPGGSAGYWSSFHKELVIYDDQAGGGRRDTWATLNHEAFHQYIFYFLGNFAPHSWYNEGNGDFFSGYQLNNSKFKLRPFDWRLGTVKENVKRSLKENGMGVVPLKEIARWTQPQYYDRSPSKWDTTVGDHYAQGWSIVYFLRTGEKNFKGWNPAYGKILDTYLQTLVETDDLNQAVDAAFAGIDWDQLEADWKAYTLSL